MIKPTGNMDGRACQPEQTQHQSSTSIAGNVHATKRRYQPQIHAESAQTGGIRPVWRHPVPGKRGQRPIWHAKEAGRRARRP